MIYDEKNWYWIVDDNETEVYSSANDSNISILNSAYVSWLVQGGIPTKISGDDMLKIRIDALEQSMTPRRIREATNGTDDGWMKGLDTQITALRAQL